MENIEVLAGKESFKESDALAVNFLLIAFSDAKDRAGIDLIGTSMDKKKLVVYRNDAMNLLKYQIYFKYSHSRKICTVIPADYDLSGNVSYLLVSRKTSGYKNTVLFKYTGRTKVLEDTTAAPLLLTYRDSRPALLMQTAKETYVLKFSIGSKFRKEKIPLELPKMHHSHTSGFVDITGNLLADLVLETLRGGSRHLEIFENRKGELMKSDVYKLPDNIGPLSFSDLDRSGFADVAFVSKEEGRSYLNVWFNDGVSMRRFPHKARRRIDLGKILSGYDAVLTSVDFDMPTGIFVSDIFCNSIPHIILTMKNQDAGHIRYVMVRCTSDRKFEVSSEFFSALFRKNVVSICFADIGNSGIESLLLNYYEDGKYHLNIYSDYLLDTNRYYIRAITYDGNVPSKGSGTALPGVSYRYKHIENGMKYVSSQLPQSSFPHLQHPFVFLGLGSAPYLVEFEGVGIPFYKASGKVFSIQQKVIPNSQLVLSPKGDTMRLYLNFTPGKNVKNVFLVLALGLFANLLVLLFLYLRDKKRERKRSQAALFNFEAL